MRRAARPSSIPASHQRSRAAVAASLTKPRSAAALRAASTTAGSGLGTRQSSISRRYAIAAEPEVTTFFMLQEGASRRRARNDICERCLLEDVAHRGTEVEPEGLETGGGPDVLDFLRPSAANRRDWPLDCADHVGDADPVGRPRERVPALHAAPARDELRVAQVDEDALEELLRDPLDGRELLALDEIARRGQLQHRPQGVIDLRGDAHASNGNGRRSTAVRAPLGPSSGSPTEETPCLSRSCVALATSPASGTPWAATSSSRSAATRRVDA